MRVIQNTNISYDEVNDPAEILMTVGRKIIELQQEIAGHKEIVAKALSVRAEFLEGVINQLDVRSDIDIDMAYDQHIEAKYQAKIDAEDITDWNYPIGI